MAGIYLHIPFCKKKCFYCDFYVSLSVKYKTPFVESLLQELFFKRDYFGKQQVNTIYFGGGTPSVLDTDEINKIIDFIYKNFNISQTPEITFEANPDDLSVSYLKELKQTLINRLSIGLQSFFADDLKLMNRRHTAQEAVVCIKNAQNAGFLNITGDLIYGLPKMTSERWQENLHIFKSLNIPHLSAYHLTYEEGTVFFKMRKDKKIAEIPDDKSEEQFKILRKFAEENNYEHYEISNFAQPGYYSKHNTGYWLGEKYLGVGPSAHSFNGNQRSRNALRIKEYISFPPEGIIYETENLSKKDKYNEYLLISLRTIWGVNTKKINKNFGLYFTENFYKNISKYIETEHVIRNCDKFTLSEKGLFISDKIMESLFII